MSYTHTHTHTHTHYIYIYIYIYRYMHTYMCVCVYVYTDTDTDTVNTDRYTYTLSVALSLSLSNSLARSHARARAHTHTGPQQQRRRNLRNMVSTSFFLVARENNKWYRMALFLVARTGRSGVGRSRGPMCLMPRTRTQWLMAAHTHAWGSKKPCHRRLRMLRQRGWNKSCNHSAAPGAKART